MSLVISLLLACGTPAPAPTTAPTEAPSAPAEAPSDPIHVAALSFPAAWLVERVGGEAVAVENITPVGEDPPHWQPPAEVIAKLTEVDLIVANGAGFEAWTRTATLPEDRLVQSADGLDLVEIRGKTHSHGKAGEHSHAGKDPHTWSDPLSFLAQAKAIHQALVAADDTRSATFDDGLGALQVDLTALHERLGRALEPAKGQALAANHPAYNYLARRYELTITSFDLDPGEAPSEAARAEVAAWVANAGDAPIMFWEDAPTEAVQAALPGGMRHVVVDPLEQPAGASYDYLAQAGANAAVFEDLFPR